MKTKRTKKRLGLKINIVIWTLVAGLFAVNYFYPLEDIWEKIFPSHYKSYAEFGIKIPTQYKVHGIDVSHHQGKINWEMAKAMKDKDISLDFAFIKATEGVSFKDKKFSYNWRKSKDAGFIRGAYHYFNPNKKGEEQAKNFIRTVTLKKGDFPPVIDVEDIGNVSSARLMKGVMMFAKKVETHYGIKPIIYTYHDFYKQNFDDTFDDYTLWIAHYFVKSPNNKSWNFWQHNDRGRVSGINTPVDFNVFNRDLEQMKGLLIQ